MFRSNQFTVKMSYLVEEEEQVGEPHGSTEVIEDVAQAVAYLGREHSEEISKRSKKSKKSKRGRRVRGTRGGRRSRRARGQSSQK